MAEMMLEKSEKAPAKGEQVPKAPMARGKKIALLLVIVIGLVVGVGYWLQTRGWEKTDDAFIDTMISPVGVRVSGSVQVVLVDDNQEVEAGAVLVQIDPKDQMVRREQAESALDAARAREAAATTHVALVKANTAALLTQANAGVSAAQAMVNSAQSQLASAEADVEVAQADATRRAADLKRYESLDARVVTQQQLDSARASQEAASAQLTASQKHVAMAQAQIADATARVAQARGVLAGAQTADQQIAAAEADLRSAQAAVKQAVAALDEAKLKVTYTSVVAPIAGRVTRKSVEVGQYVDVGQRVMAIVPRQVWVVANFKETQLVQMRPGQVAEISIDAQGGRTYRGRVESIQAGSGARFSLFPPENATGNYVKVVQRVPVKIVFDQPPSGGQVVGPGMSVLVNVQTSGGADVPLPVEPKSTAAAGN